MSSIHRQRIKAVASHIVDQLHAGALRSTEFVLTLQQEEDLKAQLVTECGAFLEAGDFDVVMKEALQMWKGQPPLPSKSLSKDGGSFSLFAQLQGTFVAPVPLEEVQEAALASDKELLTVFEKVSHIEDLIVDWAEIRPLLVAAMGQERGLQFLGIVRKWFDQGRQSSEYLSLQYDLVELTMDRVVDLVSSDLSHSSEDMLVNCIRLFRDMLLDLMQTNKFSAQGMSQIERPMLLLLRQQNRKREEISEEKSLRTAYILATIDPEALWFVSWAAHVAPERLVTLLMSTELLPELKRRCSIDSDDPMHPLLTKQAAAIFGTILQTLRVRGVPWGELHKIPTPCSMKDAIIQPEREETHLTAAPTKEDVIWTMSTLLRILVARSVSADLSVLELRLESAIQGVLSGIKALNAGMFSDICTETREGAIHLSDRKKEQENMLECLKSLL